jgi:DNA-binding CsgD family transcriptional regulator
MRMPTTNPILTKEERDVLILASVHPNLKHLGINEIGQRLGMTVTAVKTHIHQACIKLGADNRNEAVLMAVKRGEINITDLLSLEELAEILCSLDPEVLRRIANAVRQNQVNKSLPETGEQLNCMEKRQGGLLTNRERDVLVLASYGMTNLEIADKLCMSTSAVRTFLNRAFNKLGACKKADAVQIALKLREISVGEISSLDELTKFLAPMGAESIEKLANILTEKLEKESMSIAA